MASNNMSHYRLFYAVTIYILYTGALKRLANKLFHKHCHVCKLTQLNSSLSGMFET